MFRTPTENDVRELLLGSSVRFSDKGNYFSIFCPFHENKNTASAVLYKDKWFFTCFSCGTSHSFPKLYHALKGKSWGEHAAFSMSYSVPQRLTQKLQQPYIKRFEIEEGRITSVYDNAKALTYCRCRGVSDDFMQFFNFEATDLCRFGKICQGDRASIWRDRLLIPIIKNGKPYSLEGRDYTRKQIPKCLYPKHCEANVCFNQDNLDKSKPLIVCEGIMDIHKIWSEIDKNVTCTFGVSISEGQKKYLRDAEDLILFVDDDAAGHNSVGIFEKFMDKDFRVAIVNGKDPGDASTAELVSALENTVSWVDFLMTDINLFEKPQQRHFSLAEHQ